MKPMKFGVGQGIKRIEDVRFVSGRGNYASDAVDRAELKAAFHSPYGHAKFRIDDLDAARAMPAFAAFLSPAIFQGWAVSLRGSAPQFRRVETPAKPYPVMSSDEVHHVGDIIAMVVADTATQARDAVEAIGATWEDLPAVVDVGGHRARRAGRFRRRPRQRGLRHAYRRQGEDRRGLRLCAPKVRIKIVNPRAVANYMEPRSAVGEHDPTTGRLTLNIGSQGVHIQQTLISDAILNIPKADLRVITTDVGGGFGTKAMVYREYPLVLEAARRLGRSIGWMADRTEHFVGDTQGRDNVTTAEMALDAQGRFLALRLDILGNLGAYLSMYGPYVPYLGASMATGPYHIEKLHARVRGVYTHTVPVDAYRGAGRPEAAYVLERLVEACARSLGIASDELRARNFIKPEQMPYHTQTNRDYDVGDFEGAMRACLKKADRDGFPKRAEEAQKRGKIRGFGMSSYIECTAWDGPEKGSVTLEKNGDFTVLIGTQSNGQDMRRPTRRSSPNIWTCRWTGSKSCRAIPIGSPPASVRVLRDRSPSAP